MFLGQGDSSRLGEDELTTLQHIRRMTETGHIVALNPEQAQTAVEALEWYGQWRSVFRVASSLRNILILFGFFLVLWWGAQDMIVDFVQNTAGQE